jgi:hypothetical protein
MSESKDWACGARYRRQVGRSATTKFAKVGRKGVSNLGSKANGTVCDTTARRISRTMMGKLHQSHT